MALIKTKSWKYGVDLTYWIIVSMTGSKLENNCKVLLSPYISKQIRNANIQNRVKEESIAVMVPQYNPSPANVYAHIHTLDGLEGRPLCFLHDAEDDV